MITTILLVTLCSLDAGTCETFDSEVWQSMDNKAWQHDIEECSTLSRHVVSDDYWIVESTECFSISDNEA